MSTTNQEIERLSFLQTTDTLLMIRPKGFGFNKETAEDNAFQQKEQTQSAEYITRKAEQEFDAFVSILREQEIEVLVFEDTRYPLKTDAVFPNNWFSTHRNGRLFVYPMFAPSRRAEKRQDIVQFFLDQHPETELFDMREFEDQGKFLEGTGSIVMDRAHQMAYACISSRTHADVFEWFCNKVGVTGIAFHAVDREGTPIYHTNVMMAIGHQVAVVCLDSIVNQEERQKLISHLEKSGHELVNLSFDQLYQFAGNMLEVRNKTGKSFMVMSKRAHDSLNPEQLAMISKSASPLVIPLDVIETYGGGSVRCMLAEVFL